MRVRPYQHQGLQKLKGAPRNYVALACVAGFVFWFGIYTSGDKDLWSMAICKLVLHQSRRSAGSPAVAEKLAQALGQQLVFVRYSAAHRFSEWIHNDADIDHAQTVWANDLGAEENNKLVQYYPARKVWLLEPDAHPISLVPYVNEPAAPVFETVH